MLTLLLAAVIFTANQGSAGADGVANSSLCVLCSSVLDFVFFTRRGEPRPAPRVSGHVAKRLILPEAKTHLVVMDHPLSDRVISADRSWS